MVRLAELGVLLEQCEAVEGRELVVVEVVAVERLLVADTVNRRVETGVALHRVQMPAGDASAKRFTTHSGLTSQKEGNGKIHMGFMRSRICESLTLLHP